MNQRAVDKIARTFYVTLAIAGCFSSLAFITLGLYGAISESILRWRLFFVAMAVMAAWVGNLSFNFLKYVWTHDDLPTEEDDLPKQDAIGVNPLVTHNQERAKGSS